MQSTDRDSLMALDALLHIRDSIRNGTTSQIGTAVAGLERNQAGKSVSTPYSPTLGGLSGMLSNGSMHPWQGSGRSTYSQLLAIQSAQATRNQNAFLATSAHSFNSANQSAAATPSFSKSSNSSASTDTSPAGKTAQPASQNHNKDGSNAENKVTPPRATVQKESHPVRPEKIAAALRSKPQRGRKRDNLSAMERLELTRTRNREHAKSTR